MSARATRVRQVIIVPEGCVRNNARLLTASRISPRIRIRAVADGSAIQKTAEIWWAKLLMGALAVR